MYIMAKNTVKVRCYLNIIDEYEAGGTITPGMVVALASTGKVAVHSAAGGNVFPKFALEDDLQGNSITDNYSSGDMVQVWTPTPGDRVYALLKANSAAVNIGDALESGGDGTLVKYVADETSSGGSLTVNSNQIVAIAKEAVTPSTTNARIIVEII
jgi:hypothetical protein